MGKKRNKKRLQALSKQKLLDTNATAPTHQMKVATSATTEDHNFYDLEDRFMAQRQIIENLRELLNQKRESLQEQKDVQADVNKDKAILHIQEEQKLEYLYTEEIIYCRIKPPKLVKYEDTYMRQSKFSHTPDFHIKNSNI